MDELIVQTALGGVQYKLANLNLSCSLSVVGAGGVDIAGTVPTNGYMTKYAIYNPSTGAKSTGETAPGHCHPSLHQNR